MSMFDTPDDQLQQPDDDGLLASPEIRALLAQAQLGLAPQNAPTPQALSAATQPIAAGAQPTAITAPPQRTKLDSLVNFFHKISPVLQGAGAGAAAAPGPTTGLAAPGFAQQLFTGFSAANQQRYQQQQAAAKLALQQQLAQRQQGLIQSQISKNTAEGERARAQAGQVGEATTPEGKAVDFLVSDKITNPDTGKPYTPDEAYAHVKQLSQPERQSSLQQLHANAVDKALREGRDPSQDPTVQRLADSITSLQREASPKSPTSAIEKLKTQLADAFDEGDTQEVKRLQAKLKVIDPFAAERLAITVRGQNLAQDRAETTASRQAIRQHDKDYVLPAENVEKSYQMMQHAYDEYQAATAQGKQLPTGAQSMLALSTHLATTFGNVKGSRVTKDMIEHHLGARGISDKAQVAIQKLTNGDVLSPDQWNAFHDLISQSRKLSWDTAVRTAKRKDIPVDFLPDDLQPGSGAGAASGVQIIRDANGRIIGVK
jgi:hypothetical protein